MKTHFEIFMIVLTLVVLTACGSADPEKYPYAPDLDFECSFVQVTACTAANAGKDVYVGLHDNASLDCRAHLALVTEPQFPLAFHYSARTTTRDGAGILVGIATNWVNTNQMPIYQMLKKTYRLCAYIDIDGNGQVDDNEPLHESTVTIGSPYSPLSNWTNY